MGNRAKVLNKIRAMMAKTVENGCTEAEAMAALNMAQTMMDAYEVTEEDLILNDEKAIQQQSDMKDAHNIRWKLSFCISKFTDTRSFGNSKRIKFVGLKSDVEFAIWLNEALAIFVIAELKKYMWSNKYTKLTPSPKRKVINGFVIGCTDRINRKLREAYESRKVSYNSTALVVCKQHLIEDFCKDLNIKEADGRGRKTQLYSGSYSAGQAAGDKASFGRPVGSNIKMIGGY